MTETNTTDSADRSDGSGRTADGTDSADRSDGTDSPGRTESPDGTDPDELDRLSYETARAQLTEVVTQLESGGVPLDESLALWERGERLAQVCQRWLDGAQAKIDAARVERTGP